MAAAAPAPSKVFREPATTRPVQCPSCGAPITLKGFGGVQEVACSYCGSELAPEEDGALSIMRQVQRQKRESALPLHGRGQLEGTEWEILGIVWREVNVDGATYPWQEFLLYNPYQGYRWLIYQMSDGHWQVGKALDGAPKSNESGHKTVEFRKKKFKHFSTAVAVVTYVEGEFPWQVHVGDTATSHDYIAPPAGISIEEAVAPDGSADVNFTGVEHIEGKEVWKSFGMPGSCPPTHGVGTCKPNPWRKGAKWMWLSFVGLIIGLLVVAAIYLGARTNKVVYEAKNVGLTPISQEVEIGEAGKKTTLEFKFSATPLSNQWAYVDVMLINADKEEAVGFGATAEEWHGTSGGESWREGKQTQTVTIGGVEGGKYLMQITPQTGGAPGKPAPTAVNLTMRLRENVVLLRYIFIAFVIIIIFPIFNAMLGLFFEGRRWQNSDYSPSG